MKNLFSTIVVLSLAGCLVPPESPVDKTLLEPLTLLWEYEYDYYGWGPRATPKLVGDSLILITGDQNISCIYIDSGLVKWKYSVPGGRESKIRNILFNEEQFFGWQDGENDMVFALDMETGQENWSIDSSGYIFRHGLSLNNYFAPYHRTIHKISFDGHIIDTVSSDHSFIIASTYNGKVYGSLGWSPDNNSNDVGRIICYDEQTMDSLWVHEESGGSLAICYPAYEDGIMYVGTVWGANNKTLALNAETGEIIWENNSDNISAIKVILVNDLLYVETGASVRALNRETGNQIWRSNLPNPDESPTLTYLDGYIYIENYGTLYILDATTGERVHSMHGPDNGSVEQVSTGADKIFVQSTQHLYAFTPYDPEKDIE